MAFTRPIPKPICPCGAPAEVQVVDHYEPVGCFCRACGTREAQRRTAEESRPAREFRRGLRSKAELPS